jgi:glycosyltransferase involved in cell wall biosynthesis
MVRYMLEQPECRAVFSHLKQTAQGLGPLFESEIIAAKTHYVPLGVLTTPAQEAAIDTAIAARRPEEVTLLFTNSYHQLPENFVLRGGVDVVTAFLAASKHADNLRLVLRSTLPEMLGPELLRVIRTHPKIALVDGKISDEELFKLYCRAQIFLVPGAALHALSVARAMHCGLVCIASDAPGYEEYIEDEITGLMLSGRRAAIYSPEPVTGWMRDDYAPMFRSNPTFATDLAALLIHLAQSEQTRARIGAQARNWAKANLSQSASIAAFQRMLERLPA